MSAGTAGPTGSSRLPYEGERSVGQLFAAATADLSALVHDEIALAKAEIRQDVKRGIFGSVKGIVAGVFLLASLPMFSFALVYVLQRAGWLPLWGAFIAVAVGFVVIGLLLAFLAVRTLKKIEPPRRTIEGAHATADVLKNARPRPATAAELAAMER
ncbi:protein-S-isoprenylcysteine O-methyltransferase Ste14 [Kitasatospora sp. MAA4]|uniref:phage holin family protein n=1 Tax=Kitasatospora sp. MAA4 TaxID=3035093 RepID=UPI00247597AB|nr:phage holin family protein [Kitasatospora sp. MAA4]MDH6137068.1 protein-S-isoprenylcysteine O-methyltransferase Ste14 [Kitasatospora sp. MAA4]